MANGGVFRGNIYFTYETFDYPHNQCTPLYHLHGNVGTAQCLAGIRVELIGLVKGSA